MIPNKEQAIHNFWSQFGIPAYDEQTVPSGVHSPSMPYITYEVSTDNIGEPVALTGSLWYSGTSWVRITEKLHEIENYVGYGGVSIPVSGGYLWISRGQPFAQRMSDDTNKNIRRIIVNIMVEYLTAV